MSNKSLELALRIVAEATGKQSIEALVDELKRIGDTSDSVNPKAAELSRELDALGDQQQLINSFKASRNALEQQELSVMAAAMALRELQQKAKDTDAPFVQLGRNLDAAEKDLQSLREELAKQSSAHTKLAKELTKQGIDTNNLSQYQRKLGADFDATGRKVDNFTKELSQGNAQARNHAEGLRGVVAQVTALATAYVGFDRVSQAVKDVFATGDTLNDFAPINPRTQQPYFIIRSEAFGGGWNVGEAIRFATNAASKPIMLLRSVTSGHSQITTDRAVLAFRGNES